MNSFVDGIDLILATIQDALDGQVFGVNLPFVGDGLKDGAQFIEQLRIAGRAAPERRAQSAARNPPTR